MKLLNTNVDHAMMFKHGLHTNSKRSTMCTIHPGRYCAAAMLPTTSVGMLCLVVLRQQFVIPSQLTVSAGSNTPEASS
jgi:hypothetical protein